MHESNSLAEMALQETWQKKPTRIAGGGSYTQVHADGPMKRFVAHLVHFGWAQRCWRTPIPSREECPPQTLLVEAAGERGGGRRSPMPSWQPLPFRGHKAGGNRGG